jgi:hypothetical protein
MRRLAGCLVVSLLASAAAWVGCRDDLGDEALPLLAGSDVPDAIVILDDATVIADGSGEGGIPDAGSGGEVSIDAAVIIDAGSGGEVSIDAAVIVDAGSGGEVSIDAAVIVDAGSGEPGPGSDTGLGGDAYGGGSTDAGGGTDDGGGGTPDDGGGGRPDARRGLGLDPTDRTSFYACAGGPASAGLEVGLPIGLALAIAVRRRRRWRQAGAPDRAP